MAEIKKRICKRCKKEYKPTARGQKYCGKQNILGTCSYENNIEQLKVFRDKPENKLKHSEYRKKWWADFKKSSKYSEYLNKRKSQYLKLRFNIFIRDKFTCQYCGRKAPDVILQIDHIHPKSKGGIKIIDNLKTSCSDCNLGKTDILLIN